MEVKHNRTWRDLFVFTHHIVNRYYEWKYPAPTPKQKKQLEEKATEITEQVVNDPEGRYKLQKAFYEKYGYGDKFGYGSSAMAFMRWEIRRGVLNPLDHPNPGSPWWRDVNGTFLYYNVLAELVHEAKLAGTSFPKQVQFWLGYLRMPASKTWYRAHNASIVQGYIDHLHKAKDEEEAEQIFMNEVLSRVLYAQEMVNGKAPPFGCLGSLMADSKLPAVDVLVHLPAFYPDHYPLTKEDIRNILEEGGNAEDALVRILDKDLIHPQLRHLYELAAKWLSSGRLLHFIRDDKMVYPDIPDERSHEHEHS